MDKQQIIQNLINANLYTSKLEMQGAQIREPVWLIYAEDGSCSPFTYGDITGYRDYGILNFYKEELKIINRQISGDGGIYSANLIMNIPNNGVSVAFFNIFCSKVVINKLILKEIIDSSSGPILRKIITYKACKIELYNNLMSNVEISVNYTDRSEKYNQYVNGSKSGQVISNFSG